MSKFSKMFLAQEVEVHGSVVEGMEAVSGRYKSKIPCPRMTSTERKYIKKAFFLLSICLKGHLIFSVNRPLDQFSL